MDVAGFAAALRAEERDARQALERGCEEDLAAIGRLLAGPLHIAREELTEHILSLGPLDAILRRNLLAEAAEEVALRCGRRSFANADVRFRARFGMYATALQEVERRLLETHGAGRALIETRAQRRIPLPHLALDDEGAILPHCELTSESTARWTSELENGMRRAVERAVERACTSVTARGWGSLARARLAVRRASYFPSSVRESRVRNR